MLLTLQRESPTIAIPLRATSCLFAHTSIHIFAFATPLLQWLCFGSPTVVASSNRCCYQRWFAGACVHVCSYWYLHTLLLLLLLSLELFRLRALMFTSFCFKKFNSIQFDLVRSFAVIFVLPKRICMYVCMYHIRYHVRVCECSLAYGDFCCCCWLVNVVIDKWNAFYVFWLLFRFELLLSLCTFINLLTNGKYCKKKIPTNCYRISIGQQAYTHFLHIFL